MQKYFILGGFGLLVLASSALCRADNHNGFTENGFLYELRTYTANEGKLAALHQRFREHTMRLFEKHGIRNIAYWTPTDRPNTLVYLIEHADKQAAEASWMAFVADPKWQGVYAASIADGPLVGNIESVYMQATDYSPPLQ